MTGFLLPTCCLLPCKPRESEERQVLDVAIGSDTTCNHQSERHLGSPRRSILGSLTRQSLHSAFHGARDQGRGRTTGQDPRALYESQSAYCTTTVCEVLPQDHVLRPFHFVYCTTTQVCELLPTGPAPCVLKNNAGLRGPPPRLYSKSHSTLRQPRLRPADMSRRRLCWKGIRRDSR